jgi:beta-glucosidase
MKYLCSDMHITKEDFGTDFKWGVSTAAYQIEGAHNFNGKGLSIWDAFVKKRGKIFKKHHGNIACDHYNNFSKDIALISELQYPITGFHLHGAGFFLMELEE